MRKKLFILLGLVLISGVAFYVYKFRITDSGQVSYMSDIKNSSQNEEEVIALWYKPLIPFTLGRISLQGSIADTSLEITQGLSGTPYLPIGVAKVFIFEESNLWSFWMKDMNYPIDIFWLNENGRVVYIVEQAEPDTYPDTSFSPPVPAKFVIETRAGFAAENNIRIGDSAGMTRILRDGQ